MAIRKAQPPEMWLAAKHPVHGITKDRRLIRICSSTNDRAISHGIRAFCQDPSEWEIVKIPEDVARTALGRCRVG